ncbi:hypothetical protein EMCRGX_G010973 [Ephydatia muelleri]
MATSEMQRGIKWWLGLPLTPELGVCAYCPDKALDAHHAVTCKFGGDVVERHNAMRNAIFDFCKRALLNPKLEAGAGLGHERRLTRPADILIPSWSNGDKPAAIDVSITSPLISNILSEAGVVAGAAARQTEERKHTCNDTICSELGWKCVPLVVETFGAWGGTAGQFFGELASRLAAQSHSSKTTMLNNIYGRLSLILVRANARAFNARWQLAVTEECTHAFLELKKQLVSAPVLVMPQFTQEFILDADASGEGLGAILSQVIEGQERVVAYASKSKGTVASERPANAERRCLYQQWNDVPGGGLHRRLQLLLPASLVPGVLSGLHNSPVGGHLGLRKHWKRFRYISIGQARKKMWKSGVLVVRSVVSIFIQAPLQLDYSVLRPLKRIAMNISGPLPMTGRGNCYILVDRGLFHQVEGGISDERHGCKNSGTYPC